MSQAHVCPVCQGRGKVAEGFYDSCEISTTANSSVPCRACNGLGYLWDRTNYTVSPWVLKAEAPAPTPTVVNLSTATLVIIALGVALGLGLVAGVFSFLLAF